MYVRDVLPFAYDLVSVSPEARKVDAAPISHPLPDAPGPTRATVTFWVPPESRPGRPSRGGSGDAAGADPADLGARISGWEAARRAHHDASADAAARSRWKRSGWTTMTLAQRQAALAEVLHSVVVLPLPAGRSRRAPFDPALLRIGWS